MTEVLSQEEIDQLLTAINAGDTSLETVQSSMLPLWHVRTRI